MLLPDNLIYIDYNVRAHDEILFTPVKSEARCISRKREFNSHISHTFMNASPSSSGASRKTPLAVLTGRRGGRQDNGKRGVYSLGEQLYLGTYQRPLFMSSPQPSSTRPYTDRCLSLSHSLLLFSLALFSPFSTSAWFSSRIIRRQRAFTVDVYQWQAQRKIHGTARLAGRAPHEMV